MDQYNQYQQPQAEVTATPTIAPTSTSLLGVNVQDSQFWKGALLGAAVALLVTNESVQKGVIKGVAALGAAAQSGMEEMKEKFEDVKAEAQAEKAAKEA